MTKEKILKLAEKAGFFIDKIYYGELDGEPTFTLGVFSPKDEWGHDITTELAKFAELVAAKEREACANLCGAIEDKHWALYKGNPPFTGQEEGRANPYTEGLSMGAAECMAAIEARGKINTKTESET